MNNNFSKSVFVSNYDITKFNPNEYFKDYHYYEKYNANHEYNADIFKYDYKNGWGELTYQYIKYVFSFVNRSDQTYIVAERILTNDELIKLQPYCRCYNCSSMIFNPVRLFACSGCLKSNMPYPNIINDTQKYVDNMRGEFVDYYFFQKIDFHIFYSLYDNIKRSINGE